MYRSRFWTMRQYAGFATAEETNRRFRYLLDLGEEETGEVLSLRRGTVKSRTSRALGRLREQLEEAG